MRVALDTNVLLYAVGGESPYRASCLARGVAAMVSADTAFDDVPGLRRLDPIDAAALLGDAPV